VRKRWLAGLALVVLLGGVVGVLVLRDAGVQVPHVTASTPPSPEPSRTPLLTSGVASQPPPTRAGLGRALAAALRDPGLGRRVGLSVVDARTGAPLLELGADRAATPASTAKIVTALAVLTVLKPDARFTTRLLKGSNGDLVLVGAGDPTLAGRHARPGFPRAARLADLAAQVKGAVVRRVVVDDSLFSGSRLGPGWKSGYVTHGDVAPVTALMVDGGRTSRERNQPRAHDPALEAGRQLAALLGVRQVVRGQAPAGAAEVAHVDSPMVGELVELMLTQSDNDVAEALGRQVALETSLPPTFDGAAAAAVTALRPLLEAAKVDRSAVALRDASGLSPLDRLQPAALARLLSVVGRDDRYAPVLSGLPVGGFDGTLEKRYREAPTSAAAGVVRAKTGTLDGVSALAGLVRTRSGHLLAFDLVTDGVALTGTLKAQAALDRVAATLVSCGCV
jgi:D-alanyl-D-alanine carboxypeptidase/D-alanyl-D-alanine-endopeptidase (penicillin-binding protein 4)